ncbi:thioesterase II family protein [Bacillus horti]|uniref:External thioesterase TEII n=1 Tax=Caldalkalibacillus horti TaxID=77523 RepID=A0ABT9VUV5_9BACI|nr:alpha/beta fold hydrolase [Bacillus horti]MDQ0164756.1 external thioesterase TEII [Bacillus horti]
MKKKFFHQLKEGQGKHQLICFPYLGGYANSFYELAQSLDDDIEVWAVNPPGHGACTMKPLESIESMVDVYAEELRNVLKPHAIFFGHSMGGIIAFFLAQRILKSQDYEGDIDALILSACNPPCDFRTKNYSQLSDENLIDHLISYDGLSEELINEKSLLSYFLPIFRADFKVLESSAFHEYTQLDLPVHYLWGEQDKIVPIEGTTQWSKYFKRDIVLRPIANASHMFIQHQMKDVVDQLEEIMNMNLLRL